MTTPTNEDVKLGDADADIPVAVPVAESTAENLLGWDWAAFWLFILALVCLGLFGYGVDVLTHGRVYVTHGY